jgi:hypothetical protein
MKPSSAKGLSKHFALVRPGQPVLLIEYCSDCHTHNNSLRHDPDKYLQKALELKAVIQREFPFFKIVLEPLDVTRKDARNRLGLLEVTMASADFPQPRVMASKLKTLKWPETRTVVSNIRGSFPGRSLTVALQVPAEEPFHPKNLIANSIKVVLVSENDLPQFQEKLIQKPKRTATTALPRSRTLSAIVQKKIQSGVIKEAEIDDLLVPKTFVAEQRSGGELTMEFPNVKPGAYKVVVMANRNFVQSSQDLFVLPVFRGKEEPLTVKLPVIPQKTAFFSLAVEYEPDNPVFRISFQRNATGMGQSMTEEELELIAQTSQGQKSAALYQIADLAPGHYVLDCELKDFQVVKTEVDIFPGLNSFRLHYPELRLAFIGEQETDALASQKVTVSEEISAAKGKNQKANLQESSMNKKGRGATADGKENHANHSHSDQAVPERQNSRLTSDMERTDNEDRHPFQKQRGASGNRIRPGERLYSAKSKSNQQVLEEQGKNQLVVTGGVSQFKNDPAFQLLERNLAPDCLNIFLKTNPQFKLEFEFVIDKGESIEDQSQFYQERLVEGDFEQHCLRHVQGFEFGRIFVERLAVQATEATELFVINGPRVTRVNLSEYFSQMVNDNEPFCDIAIIVNNAERTDFEELVGLVPMTEPIKCFTGILEIKSITNFVRNSKFGVEKFFGFEDDTEDVPRATLSRFEAVESLRNYEIEFSSAYVLNAIRVDKKGTVCLQKLHETYGQWQRMGEAIEELEFDDDDGDIEEQDEEFETGGNLEETGEKRLDEEDEFKDEEFD